VGKRQIGLHRHTQRTPYGKVIVCTVSRVVSTPSALCNEYDDEDMHEQVETDHYNRSANCMMPLLGSSSQLD